MEVYEPWLIPEIDQIAAEVIQSGGDIHKHINSVCNKEALHQQWKESITVYVCKKSHKTECSNYWGLSFLSTTYKTLSNILLRLTLHFLQSS
jgi:hypothetical protein